MTWLVLTNASAGATRNAGTNGDLCTLLDWALPQAGWAIEYTASNARVYRAASGNRNRLFVQHDSAVSGNAGFATVRGCENASAAAIASLTDPFPLVAQIANNVSNWMISNTANTTDRPFRIYLNETFVFYFSNFSGTADLWDVGFFGDVPSQLTDPYNTIVSVRNSTSTANSLGMGQVTSAALTGGSNIFWVRDITGATKSSRGVLNTSGANLGAVAGTTTARGGYQNRVYRERVAVGDAASTSATPSTLGLIRRAYVPNMWSGLHTARGTLTDADTFTDVAYNPAATFRGLAGNISSGWAIIEETDTWAPP